MAVRSNKWTHDELGPLKIVLDHRNPRIEVPRNATQMMIREKLLAHEDVADLARKIIKSDGLMHGDRIITLVENSTHTVLEGNRRVAACQMLLDPTLIPTGYKQKFPRASPALKKNIKLVLSDVAPSREAAEPILTRRHTEQGVKPWSPVAKMRRAARWLDDGLSFEDVATKLGTTTAQVRKLVRPYRLFTYALNLNGWTPNERSSLEDEKLKTNPYTRFFTLQRTKEILGLSFDGNEQVASTLEKPVFVEQMTRIARDFLLPDPVKKKPRMDTRTKPEDYFSEFVKTAAGKKAVAAITIVPKSAKTGGGPLTPRASVFFEKLECNVHDDTLLMLTKEIRQVDHQRMPITASLLLRALFEASLVEAIRRKTGAWAQVVTQAGKGKDPGLSLLVSFAGNFANGIFQEQRICHTLVGNTTANAKSYLDLIAHGKWVKADPAMVFTCANNLRKIIEHILSGK